MKTLNQHQQIYFNTETDDTYTSPYHLRKMP